MNTVEDLIVELKPAQAYSVGGRLIEVNLASKLNLLNFDIGDFFRFEKSAIAFVQNDLSKKGAVLISILTNPSVSPASDMSVQYEAISRTGDGATGRIIIKGVEYEILSAPIDIAVGSTCELPDTIVIDVRNYYGGANVILESLYNDNPEAGSTVLSDIEGSDFSNGYNASFGGTAGRKIITYTLNKTSGFWKTLNAQHKMKYTITYGTKSATNYITITNNNLRNI